MSPIATRDLVRQGKEILQRVDLIGSANMTEQAYVLAMDEWNGFSLEHARQLVEALDAALNPSTPVLPIDFQQAVAAALTTLLYRAAGNEDDEEGPSMEDIAKAIAPRVALAMQAAITGAAQQALGPTRENYAFVQAHAVAVLQGTK